MHFVKSQKLVIRQESRSPPFKLPQEIAEQDTLSAFVQNRVRLPIFDLLVSF